MIQRKPLRWGLFWWTCDWILALGVVWGSLAPGSQLPHVVTWFTAGMSFNDKILHFASYLLLAFWFAGSVERRSYLPVALLLCALGGAIEWAQYLMGLGRTAEWRDFLADAAGVGVAMTLVYAGLGPWMAWVEQRLEQWRD